VRYPKEQKAETRRKIVDAAARLFRERGYGGVGVDAIMSEVGLTAGGFYAHFPSKESLFAEAMATALDKGNARLAARSPAAQPADPLRDLVFGYLSRKHRDTVAEGCPLPSLTSDVARSGDATRELYEQQILGFLRKVESLLPEGDVPARTRAMGVIAQCVGGLMISRAVKDEELSNRILRACREAAMKVSGE
jgi:TetR/AcrR family transcriptional repressor of nem operon